MALPLAGIRVLDLTRLFPGDFATLLLADQGADVIKVEDLSGGDYLRWVAPPLLFQALNRGKRSLTLDVRHLRGHEAFLRLVAAGDVVVESFRPGTLARQGLGWEALRKVNPRLIYCALSGYGQNSPQAQRSGHDINFVARAGLLAGQDRPLPVQVADFCGGYAAAFAIVAALQGRQGSGQGAFLDISLAASALPLLVTRIGSEQLSGALASYSLYETAGGRFLAVAALEPKFFQRLLAALGRPDLMEWHYDAARQDNLRHELAAVFRTRTRDEWEALFAAHDACVEPVREPEEALQQMAGNDPAALMAPLGRASSTRPRLRRAHRPGAGGIRLLGGADRRVAFRRRDQNVGEHLRLPA